MTRFDAAAVTPSADGASRAPSFRDLSPREAAILAAILLATVAVYLPSLRNGWVFDDTSQIVKSLPLHSWTESENRSSTTAGGFSPPTTCRKVLTIVRSRPRGLG